MFKIFTIVGARPQFIKAAAISRAIRNHFSQELIEVIVHTGQHYDADMSDVFFEELQIPKPEFHLHIGSGTHGRQTAAMLDGIEQLLSIEKPDLVLVYGDTNSTLAAALAAAKIQIPVVHVEAGLRSFNKAMPEEINRILTDHTSTLLFTPTPSGLKNLAQEGFSLDRPLFVDQDHPLTLQCGDVMYDNALFFKTLALKNNASWFEQLNLIPGQFFLATIHRNANTDDPLRLKAILSGMCEASRKKGWPVVLPLHPRTKKMMATFAETDSFFASFSDVEMRFLPPATYLQMVLLEATCAMVLTDSGGVQKEAYFYEKPCVVLRPETEWVELVESGAAKLVDADANLIVSAVENFSNKPFAAPTGFYGNGMAAEFICTEILKFLRQNQVRP